MDLEDTNKRLEELERKLLLLPLLVLDTHLALLVIIDPQSSSSPSSNVLHYIKSDDFNDDLYEQIVSRNSGTSATTQNYFFRDDMGTIDDDLVMETSPDLQPQEFDDDYLPLPPRLPPREIDPARHYGLYQFSGPDPLHCSLGRDEPVYLLNDDDNYWWLIRKLSTEEKEEKDPDAIEDPEDGKIGFVPAECLETYGERLARLNCFKNEEIEKIDIIPEVLSSKLTKLLGKAVKFSLGVIFWEGKPVDNHIFQTNTESSEPKRLPLGLDFDSLEDSEPLGGIRRPIVVMDDLDDDNSNDDDDHIETPVQAYPDQMFSMGLLKVPAKSSHLDGSTSGAGLDIVSEVYSDKVLVVGKRKKSTSPPIIDHNHDENSETNYHFDGNSETNYHFEGNPEKNHNFEEKPATNPNFEETINTPCFEDFDDLREYNHESMIDEYNFTNEHSFDLQESAKSQQDLNSPKLLSPERLKSDKTPLSDDLNDKHLSTTGKIEEFLQKLNLTEDEAQLLEFSSTLNDEVNFDLDNSSNTPDLVIKKSNQQFAILGELGSPIMHQKEAEAENFQSDLDQYIFSGKQSTLEANSNGEGQLNPQTKTPAAVPGTRRSVSAGEALVDGRDDSFLSTPKGVDTLGVLNDLISHKSTPLSKKSPSVGGKKKKRKNSPRVPSDLFSMSPYSPGTPMRASWSRVSSDLYRRLDIMDQLNQMTADIQEQFGIVDEEGGAERNPIVGDDVVDKSLILGDLAENSNRKEESQQVNVSRVSSVEKSSVISTPTPARVNKFNDLIPQATRDFDFNLQDYFSDALFNSIRRSTTEVNVDSDDTPLTSTALLVDKREKSIQDMFVPILGKFDELAERLAELNKMI